MKTERTGHAELTPHLTAHLGGHAEGRSVFFGDIDGLDKLIAYGKEVLTRTVHTNGLAYRGMATDGVLGFECLASLEGDVSHLVKGRHTTDIEPLRQLFTGKSLQSDV